MLYHALKGKFWIKLTVSLVVEGVNALECDGICLSTCGGSLAHIVFGSDNP